MNSKGIDISIIIPVYNTPKLKIVRCLDSVKKFMEIERKANYNCEVLIVDDGSTLPIEKYCINYIDNDYFHFYKKDNGGVSSARNVGLKKASGKYICFVDSDDELIIDDPIYFNKYSEYDLILTDLVFDNNNKTELWNALNYPQGPVSIKDLLEKITIDGKTNGPVCKYVKKEYLIKHDILFDERMICGEDLIFLINILQNAPKIFYLKKINYHYYFEEETSNARVDKSFNIVLDNNISMYVAVINLIKTCIQNHEDAYRLRLQETERYIKQIFGLCMEIALNQKKINKKDIDDSISYIEDEDLKRIYSAGTTRCKIEFSLLKINNTSILWILAKIRRLYLKLKSRY